MRSRFVSSLLAVLIVSVGCSEPAAECLDEDLDGVCSGVDICPEGQDSADLDGDAVPDACDLCPLDAEDDSDGDGSCDSDDLCRGDDTTGDTDGDGVCDSDDLCAAGDDALDFDGDGVADACDLCPIDLLDDSDSDGSCDWQDLCTGDDTTGDGDLDRVCGDLDPCPLDFFDDLDGDGVCSGVDLCPGSDDTVDPDGDGVPSGCDPCPADDPDDSDGDGVCDGVDLCSLGPDASDYDGDGVPDACDPCPLDALDDSDLDGSCDWQDLCTGDDATGDEDLDGVCGDLDPCPLDRLGDSDGDGSCDSADLCSGDDATGDPDGDGLCDDSDPCPNFFYNDTNNNGVCDNEESPVVVGDLSGGNAHGYPVVDGWGNTWDGNERLVASWADAASTCGALGARLPTMTEIYRVGSRGTEEVGDTYTDHPLWTLIPYQSGSPTSVWYAAVRLTDGVVSSSVSANLLHFRCLWPREDLAYFAGDGCNGPPGAGCFSTTAEGGRYHLDLKDRPVVSYQAATAECEFHHAHLPMQLDYVESITAAAGLPNGSGDHLWSATRSGLRATTVAWTDVEPGYADSTELQADVNTTTVRPFRCIGVASAHGEHPNALSDVVVAPATHLTGDASNRTATDVTYEVPATDCLTLGGHFPTVRDYVELARAGLLRPVTPFSSQLAADNFSSSRINYVALPSTPDPYFYGSSAQVSENLRTTPANYRCVYFPLDIAYAGPTSCQGGCFQVANGTPTPAQVWMDQDDRPPQSYDLAVADCYSNGGHLAHFRDYFELIRAGLPGGSGTFLFTSDTAFAGWANQIAWTGVDTAWLGVLPTDIFMANKATATAPYRCVWTNELR